jgi:four helix bundle protein
VRGERLEVGIKSYEDLRVYQVGYKLALEIHHLTQSFPQYERYELGQQLRKAAVSIPLNIVEGYGRQSAKAEFRHFVRNALGSSNEVIVLLKIVEDLGYSKTLTLQNSYDELGKQLYKLRETWQ